MAMDFDGVDQHVDIGDVAPLDITGSAITLAIWANNTVNGEHKLIAKWKDAGSLFSYLLSINASDKALLAVHPVGEGQATTIGTTTIATGTWFHIAGTYDGTTLRIYVNGVEENSNTITGGNLRSVAAPVRIGSGSGDGEEPMDGILDDARIYDRALSADEILTIYNSRGRDGIALNLKARYLLNEGAPGVAASGAGVIKDSGPNGLDGTPANSPIWASGQLRFSRKPLLAG